MTKDSLNLQYLQLESVKKAYSQGTYYHTIFDNVNFIFKKGITYAITGSSGAGKSTLLHILAGLDEPSSGTVYFNNDNLSKLSTTQKEFYRSRSFGFMFQNPYLIDELTILENIMVKGDIIGMNYKECRNLALSILENMGISHKAHSLPSTLSGGQQQRVALARALLGKPDFLCADEPTGNLDKITGIHIFKLLKKYQQQWGMGIIMNTHETTLFEQMDIILKLENGVLKVHEKTSFDKLPAFANLTRPKQELRRTSKDERNED